MGRALALDILAPRTCRPGAEGLRQAPKLLGVGTVEKKLVLPTEMVTKENADAILKKNGLF
jgi:ribose transport system substrate-binding protein